MAEDTKNTIDIPEGLEDFMRRAAYAVFRRAGRLLASRRQADDCARQALARLWLAKPPEESEALAEALVRAGDEACLSMLAGQSGLSNEWLQHMERNKGQTPEQLGLREQLIDWLTPLAPADQAVLVHHYIDGMDRERNARICELSRANIDRRLELFAEQVAGHLPEGASNPFAGDSRPAEPDEFAAEQASLEQDAGRTDEQKRWLEERLSEECRQVASLAHKIRDLNQRSLKRSIHKAVILPALAAALTVGLFLVAAWPSSEGPEPIDPGADPFKVEFVLSRGLKTRDLKPKERLRSGDVLAYRVALSRGAFVLVAGLSTEGEARFPFDKGPLNWPLRPKSQMLPVFTRIDGSRDAERIFVFFCDEAPDEAESLLEMLEQAYPLDRDGRRDLSEQRLHDTGLCQVRSELFFIEEESRPEGE